jgi:2-dehydro-3-deoxyphosphogluconate aldolase/(4S)-4-hydroxy-2-oxoglutarate aldolase
MSLESHNALLDAVMTAAPVIPVIVIDRVEDALPLARALVAGGLPVLEVTLRTPAALEAMRAMAGVPGAIVGAGTVLDATQYDAAIAAGARFVVSPGLTERLAAAARERAVPLLPGTATASEVMAAREAGFTRLTFFPAESAGGVSALKGLCSVFRDVRFCPTGGITAAIAPAYLALPQVACVGGSWPMPADAIQAGDWARVEALAREAAGLRRGAKG